MAFFCAILQVNTDSSSYPEPRREHVLHLGQPSGAEGAEVGALRGHSQGGQTNLCEQGKRGVHVVTANQEPTQRVVVKYVVRAKMEGPSLDPRLSCLKHAWD